MDDNPQFLINAIEYLQKNPIPDPPKQQLNLDLEEFTIEKQKATQQATQQATQHEME
jgi:hypothetical protein